MSKRQVLVMLTPTILVISIFFIFPMLVVLYNSFVSNDGGLTLENYKMFFTDSYYYGVLGTTLKVSILTTIITLIIGYSIAYYVTKFINKKWLKRTSYIIIISPLFTSAVVRSFGWMIILGKDGFINNLLMDWGIINKPIKLLYNEVGITIGLIYILLPFMILSLISVLQNIDKSLEDAASDLGLTPFKSFLKVTFPLSFPGILAGSVMVFSLSISAYVTPAMMSGGKLEVLSMVVYDQMMEIFNYQFGSSISFIMLFVSLIILALNSYLFKSDWVKEG